MGIKKGNANYAIIIKYIGPMLTEGVATAGLKGRKSISVKPMAGFNAWVGIRESLRDPLLRIISIHHGPNLVMTFVCS